MQGYPEERRAAKLASASLKTAPTDDAAGLVNKLCGVFVTFSVQAERSYDVVVWWIRKVNCV